MLPFVQKSDHVSYTRWPNGVHEFVLHDNTRAAFEECYVLLNTILGEQPPDQPIRWLFDLREAGIAHIGYIWQLTRQLVDNHHPLPVIYEVVLHNLHGILADTFTKLVEMLAILPGAHLRFFAGDTREVALQWLLDHSTSTGLEG